MTIEALEKTGAKAIVKTDFDPETEDKDTTDSSDILGMVRIWIQGPKDEKRTPTNTYIMIGKFDKEQEITVKTGTAETTVNTAIDAIFKAKGIDISDFGSGKQFRLDITLTENIETDEPGIGAGV